MKKILLLLTVIAIFAMPVSAKVFKGKAVEAISTKNPTNVISVKSVRNFDMQGIEIKRGYILTGTMSDIVPVRMASQCIIHIHTAILYR